MEQKITSVVFFFCLAGLFFPVSRVLGQSEHTAKLIEGAKKEGKLVWYTSIQVPEATAIVDAFKKKFPFVGNVEVSRASAESTFNRILTEARAGKSRFDVVAISGLEILARHQQLLSYASPEAEAYIPEFKDRNGHWTGIYVIYYVIGYNTRFVSEKEAPRRWEDLLDSKWRGKIAIDREEYPWYATLIAAWGKEKTASYMRALAKQDIQWRKGHNLIGQLMAAGEFPVAIVYAHRTELLKERGAPVDWADSVDPVVTSVSSIGLSAKAPNPNTAKLFVDFVLSKEGQHLLRSQSRVPARLDVQPFSPKMDQRNLKLKMVPEDLGVRYNEYVQEFRSIFGL